MSAERNVVTFWQDELALAEVAVVEYPASLLAVALDAIDREPGVALWFVAFFLNH